jgi:peptide/histidine transporter 3/4
MEVKKDSEKFESIDLQHSITFQVIDDAERDYRDYRRQSTSLSPFDMSGTLSALYSSIGLNKKGRASDPNKLPFRENPMFTRAPFILGQEFCERLAYYGIATNIVTYLTNQMNYTTSQAASYNQIWSGTCYLTPLLGAFLADAYLGRYWVILSFSLIYIVGLVILAVSAGVPALTPTLGMSPSTLQAFVFWFAMSLIALGTGGIKPNVSTFGADQFDPKDMRHRRQIPRFFNWFYAAINGGAILSALVVVNVQTGVSWWAGFTIPACAFALACILFVGGSRLYRRLPPGGSPLTRIYQTIRVALKKRKCLVENSTDLYEVDDEMSIVPGQPKLSHTDGMIWLDKAAAVVHDSPHLDTIPEEQADKGYSKSVVDAEKQSHPSSTSTRFLKTVTEVESVKAIIRLLPIAFTLVFYNAIYAQMLSMFVLQGNGMNTQLGSLTLSAATVSVLDSISVIIFVVIYDLLIAPTFRRIGRPISPLVRIGVGYCFAILSMIVAGCVEIARLNVASNNGLTDVKPVAGDSSTIPPISVWWQIPQYSLVGISEVFAMIGSMEFFYQQAPDSMRSTCAALQLLTVGIGSYVAAALVAIIQAITTSGGQPGWIANNINQGHLDYFFFTLAIIMAIVLVGYVFIAQAFVYRNLDHVSYDVGAVGLTSDRTSCVPSGFNRELAHQIDDGIVGVDSLRSGFGGPIGRRSSLHEYLSQIRSQKTDTRSFHCSANAA